jgi:MFS family permease
MAVPSVSTASPVRAEEARPFPRPAVAWYAVIVLMVCYTLSFVDRLILAFLVTPLKADLSLNDTQIGLLQGFAFAVLYTLLGIPCGLLADRFSRRNLIALGVLVWSLMTCLASGARSFATLALARTGVGVGESALAPAAFSMIADLFPKERLSSALSVYSMGVQLGAGLALLVGGLVVQAVTGRPPVSVPLLGIVPAWRLTFLMVGLPGILVAALLLTVREPLRRTPPAISTTAPRSGGRAAREMLLRWPSCVGLSILMACQAMGNYAFGSWAPSFFERLHGWPKDRIGLTLGLLTIVCGCAGLLAGGRLSDRWLKAGVAEAPLKVGLVSLLGVLATLVPAVLVPSSALTVALLVPAAFFLALPIGCSYAAIQMIFPAAVRGTVSAAMLVVLNLLGMTLGSLLPGLLDNQLFHSDQAIGMSIALTAAGSSLIGALAALLTFGPFRRDFEAQARMQPASAAAQVS